MPIRSRQLKVLLTAALAVAITFGSTGLASTVTDALGASMTISGSAEPDDSLQRASRLDVTPRTDIEIILDLTNQHRALHGIAALELHPQLNAAAEIHALDHTQRDCLTELSHAGSDGSRAGDRIARTGLRVRNWGENIACGHLTAPDVVRAWIESPGHLANILNSDFTHLGVATSFGRDGRPYWGQAFGTIR